MDQAVRQRVVGAVVLVALGVIFIPILLEGPEQNAMPEFNAVPEAMVDLRGGQIRPNEQVLALPPQTVTTVVIETPSAQAARPEAAPAAEPPQVQVAPKPAPKPTQSDSPQVAGGKPSSAEESTPKTSSTPHGWVVQLGSFGKESNALGLRDRMRKAGYATFVERVAVAAGTRYRVRVGPELKRELADQLQAKIAREQGIQGRVMSHP